MMKVKIGEGFRPIVPPTSINIFALMIIGPIKPSGSYKRAMDDNIELS